MRAIRVPAVAGGLLAAVLVAGGLGAIRAGHAEEIEGYAAPATRATGPDSTVTLPTGERVRLTSAAARRMVASVDPPPGAAPNPAGARPTVARPFGAAWRARTLSVGEHMYVVPQAAMPYVGRQLDLALFDVSRPPAQVEVDWAPGVRPRALPGLTLRAAGAGTSVGRVTGPAAFGAALTAAAKAHAAAKADAATKTGDAATKTGDAATKTGDAATKTGDAGVLAGIEQIRPARAADPTGPPPAHPAYPQATLVVKGIDVLGGPANFGGVSVSNADDVLRFGSMRSFAEGEVAFSVPVGTYSLSVDITTFTADQTYVSDALVVLPQIQVTSPRTEVTVDARTADTVVPVPRTPLPANRQQIQLTYGRTAASGGLSTTSYLMVGGSPQVYVTPTDPVSVGDVHWYTFFHLASPATAAEPYVYDLHLPAEGEVPDRFPTEIRAASLARIDAAYHAETPAHTINVHRASIAPWELMSFRATSAAVAPLRRTEYVSALPDVGWVGVVQWRPEEGTGHVYGPVTAYRPGDRRPDDFLAAPLAPAAAPRGTAGETCVACRRGDVLALAVQPWSDPGGHAVDSLVGTDSLEAGARLRVYADGELLGLPSLPWGSITVPPATAEFRLELDTVKSAPWTTTATRAHTAWTWPAGPRPAGLPAGLVCTDGSRDCALEPVLLLELDSPVGLDNAVPVGTASALGLRVRRQGVAAPPELDRLTVEVSADDGQTWQPATVRAEGAGRYTASLLPAANAAHLSLRVRAADVEGSAVDQTIIRAVRVPTGVGAGTTGVGRTTAVGAGATGVGRAVCPAVAPPRVACFARVRAPATRHVAGALPEGYGPADLRSAYQFPATGGADQVVAIVVAFTNPNAEADLAVYRETYGLPPCTVAAGCLRIVNQDGAAAPLPPPDQGWGTEMALDLDMVSAVCPACRLLVVAANSNSLDDLGAAVDTAARLGADVINNSYGTGVEFAGQRDYEQHYNHPGTAVVASAGDSGYSVSYPAASEYVTAVGGTTLTRTDAGVWAETVWAGTGSGCSAYIPKPAWQTDRNCPMRTVNDVAAVADLTPGVAMYDTFGGGGWLVSGGTSVAAPIISAGYALTGTASRVRYGATPWQRGGSAFRDVTAGTNVPGPGGITCGGDYLCAGQPGYDAPTGWGTPLGLTGLTAP